METSLTKEAEAVLLAYEKLPFGEGCNVPYFNNRRAKIIGGLRVFIGKGTPEDIIEEIEIISLKERFGLKEIKHEELKKFLVDHGLGIDCSGLAFHLLSAECKSRGFGNLSRKLHVNGNFLRKLKKIIRPAESVNVHAFALENNSLPVGTRDARAGDFIVFLGTGKEKTYNHIMVITKIETSGNGLMFSYVHSYKWPSDGKYDHGVRRGKIRVTDIDVPLTKAIWEEKGASGKDNYTLESAILAQSVSLRRLRVFA